MATIEHIIERKPHLRSPLLMYEKVRRFEEAVHAMTFGDGGGDADQPGFYLVSYPAESVGAIIEKFSSIFELPRDMLAPLQEAMELNRIDLTRLPLNEVPAFSLPYQESELAPLLFLLGRPFFFRMRRKLRLEGMFWQEGKCPACNSTPVMASLKGDEKKAVFCPFCGGCGFWKRIGCPACQNEDASKLEIFLVEEEKDFMINICNECNCYHKTVKAGLLDDHSPDMLDIISMPLDVVAQGKGYRRPSPNPIGMTVMV